MQNIQALLAPRSVVVVGATERQQHGGVVYRNLLQNEVNCPVFPINPVRDTINGRKSYPGFAELPDSPDCAVLAIPAKAVPTALREGAARGLKAAIVLSSGFAEAGEAGRLLQEEIGGIVADAGIALCGPNCIGIVNVPRRNYMYASMLPMDLPAGGVSVVAQSGSVAHMLLNIGRVGCNYAISIGNQAGLQASDYIDFVVDDPNTKVVALYSEGIGDGERFLSVIEKANRLGKPVVAIQPGRSRKAADAAMTHTGTMASSYEVFSAVCRQHGVVQVDDIDELVEFLALASDIRNIPRKRGLALVNYSGGENAIATDLCGQLGIELPGFSPRTTARLGEVLPPFAAVDNPLDVTGALYYDTERYQQSLLAAVEDDTHGMMIAVQDIPASRVPETVVPLMLRLADAVVTASMSSDKAVALLTNVSGEVQPNVAARLKAGGVPILEGGRKGLQAAARMLAWATRARTGGAIAGSGVFPKTRVQMSPGGGMLLEPAVMALLRENGLPVVDFIFADSSEGTVEAAEQLGYPVVLKIVSPDVVHKSDCGGVKLGLRSSSEVTEAYEALMTGVRHAVPSARLEGVVVARMVENAYELALGMKRDQEFGPIVMLAMGGIFIEIVDSFVLRRAPMQLSDAHQMIAELPGARILGGERGCEPGDIEALAALLTSFSGFCASLDNDVQQIDLNPIFVLPGKGGVAIGDAVAAVGVSCRPRQVSRDRRNEEGLN